MICCRWKSLLFMWDIYFSFILFFTGFPTNPLCFREPSTKQSFGVPPRNSYIFNLCRSCLENIPPTCENSKLEVHQENKIKLIRTVRIWNTCKINSKTWVNNGAKTWKICIHTTWTLDILLDIPRKKNLHYIRTLPQHNLLLPSQPVGFLLGTLQ